MSFTSEERDFIDGWMAEPPPPPVSEDISKQLAEGLAFIKSKSRTSPTPDIPLAQPQTPVPVTQGGPFGGIMPGGGIGDPRPTIMPSGIPRSPAEFPSQLDQAGQRFAGMTQLPPGTLADESMFATPQAPTGIPKKGKPYVGGIYPTEGVISRSPFLSELRARALDTTRRGAELVTLGASSFAREYALGSFDPIRLAEWVYGDEPGRFRQQAYNDLDKVVTAAETVGGVMGNLALFDAIIGGSIDPTTGAKILGPVAQATKGIKIPALKALAKTSIETMIFGPGRKPEGDDGIKKRIESIPETALWFGAVNLGGLIIGQSARVIKNRLHYRGWPKGLNEAELRDLGYKISKLSYQAKRAGETGVPNPFNKRELKVLKFFDKNKNVLFASVKEGRVVDPQIKFTDIFRGPREAVPPRPLDQPAEYTPQGERPMGRMGRDLPPGIPPAPVPPSGIPQKPPIRPATPLKGVTATKVQTKPADSLLVSVPPKLVTNDGYDITTTPEIQFIVDKYGEAEHYQTPTFDPSFEIVQRAVWNVKKGDELELAEPDDLSIDGSKNLGVVHISSESDYWGQKLVDDYDREGEYKIIEIAPTAQDRIIEDIQYAIPDDSGVKKDSGILVTPRKKLIYGKDWVFKGEEFTDAPVAKPTKKAPPAGVTHLMPDGTVMAGPEHPGAVPGSETAPVAKEPWEMTREEYVNKYIADDRAKAEERGIPIISGMEEARKIRPPEGKWYGVHSGYPELGEGGKVAHNLWVTQIDDDPTRWDEKGNLWLIEISANKGDKELHYSNYEKDPMYNYGIETDWEQLDADADQLIDDGQELVMTTQYASSGSDFGAVRVKDNTARIVGKIETPNTIEDVAITARFEQIDKIREAIKSGKEIAPEIRNQFQEFAEKLPKKESWEMTREEYGNYLKKEHPYETSIGQKITEDYIDKKHRYIINRTLNGTKSMRHAVPPKVLADYPDLAEQAVKPPGIPQTESPLQEMKGKGIKGFVDIPQEMTVTNADGVKEVVEPSEAAVFPLGGGKYLVKDGHPVEVTEAGIREMERKGAVFSDKANIGGGGQGPIRRKHEITKEVAEPYRITSIKKMKSYPEYVEGKSGDRDKAFILAEKLLPLNKIKEIEGKFGKNVIYTPVRAVEASGKNKIPEALAERIATVSGAGYDTEILQISLSHHTGANAMQRLLNRPVFNGEVSVDRPYVIVDDAIGMGGTVAEKASFIIENGGTVAGVICGGQTRGGNLWMDNNEIQKLLEEINYDSNEFGIEPEALTSQEAKYLSKFKTPESFRNRVLQEREQSLSKMGQEETGYQYPVDLSPPKGADQAIPSGIPGASVLRGIQNDILLHRTIQQGLGGTKGPSTPPDVLMSIREGPATRVTAQNAPWRLQSADVKDASEKATIKAINQEYLHMNRRQVLNGIKIMMGKLSGGVPHYQNLLKRYFRTELEENSRGSEFNINDWPDKSLKQLAIKLEIRTSDAIPPAIKAKEDDIDAFWEGIAAEKPKHITPMNYFTPFDVYSRKVSPLTTEKVVEPLRETQRTIAVQNMDKTAEIDTIQKKAHKTVGAWKKDMKQAQSHKMYKATEGRDDQKLWDKLLLEEQQAVLAHNKDKVELFESVNVIRELVGERPIKEWTREAYIKHILKPDIAYQLTKGGVLDPQLAKLMEKIPKTTLYLGAAQHRIDVPEAMKSMIFMEDFWQSWRVMAGEMIRYKNLRLTLEKIKPYMKVLEQHPSFSPQAYKMYDRWLSQNIKFRPSNMDEELNGLFNGIIGFWNKAMPEKYQKRIGNQPYKDVVDFSSQGMHVGALSMRIKPIIRNRIQSLGDYVMMGETAYLHGRNMYHTDRGKKLLQASNVFRSRIFIIGQEVTNIHKVFNIMSKGYQWSDKKNVGQSMLTAYWRYVNKYGYKEDTLLPGSKKNLKYSPAALKKAEKYMMDTQWSYFREDMPRVFWSSTGRLAFGLGSWPMSFWTRYIPEITRRTFKGVDGRGDPVHGTERLAGLRFLILLGAMIAMEEGTRKLLKSRYISYVGNVLPVPTFATPGGWGPTMKLLVGLWEGVAGRTERVRAAGWKSAKSSGLIHIPGWLGAKEFYKLIISGEMDIIDYVFYTKKPWGKQERAETTLDKLSPFGKAAESPSGVTTLRTHRPILRK